MLSGTQRTAQFTVGSENFTEQEVLGHIAIEALKAADATVIDRTSLGGNEDVRKALVDQEVDLYWEYTATGLSSSRRPISSPILRSSTKLCQARSRRERHQMARTRPGK
jgi:glycine betaine/choline ABC-type transport system substrate-binding protein